jgi:hypothetical protein
MPVPDEIKYFTKRQRVMPTEEYMPVLFGSPPWANGYREYGLVRLTSWVHGCRAPTLQMRYKDHVNDSY